DGTAASEIDALKAIKEQLRAVPRRGIGYGMLRYLTDAATGASEPSMLFNYLGQLDHILSRSTLFRFASESTGPWHAPTQQRRHLVEVNGQVIRGQLAVAWTYVPSLTPDTDIQQLADEFVATLRRVIAHCDSEDAWGRTPSDFPLARL